MRLKTVRETIEYLCSHKNTFDDPATWKLIQEGKTSGCFQIESQLCKKTCKELLPENLEHLSAVIAIVRPGVRENLDENGRSLADIFCQRKRGLIPVEYPHEALKPILETTYGILTYQEQSLSIARHIAGYSLQDADSLRRSMGKKVAEEMTKNKEKFIEGCKKLGVVDEQLAHKLFSWIEKGQRYLFVRAHSMCYAAIAYNHAYLKAHMTKKFLCSWLTYCKDDQHTYQEIEKLVFDSKFYLNPNGKPIDILPPDFRLLNKDFVIEDDNIRFGFVDIRGIGESSFAKLLTKISEFEASYNKKRDQWDWYDFLIFSLNGTTKKISKGTIDPLISSGAISYLGVDKKRMYHETGKLSNLTELEADWAIEHASEFSNITELLESLARPKKEGGGASNKNRIQIIKGLIASINNPPYSLKDSHSYIAFEEKKALGVSITCSKVDDYSDSVANCNCLDLNQGKVGFITLNAEILDCRETKIKNGKNKGKEMAFLKVSDSSGGFDNVVCFSEAYEKCKSLFSVGNVLVLIGERKKDQGLVIQGAHQL